MIGFAVKSRVLWSFGLSKRSGRNKALCCGYKYRYEARDEHIYLGRCMSRKTIVQQSQISKTARTSIYLSSLRRVFVPSMTSS